MVESSPPATWRCGAAGSSCGVVARAWSEEEAANRREGPFVGWFLYYKYYTAETTPLEVLTLHRYGAALSWTTVVRRHPRSHLWG
ncbi:hypothetical protein Taro_016904 [Colocasia esculenta]|uniref:Uncharacterized protein n=1 Tax=Colocasia esculenta TaxID=4460 RepID=A0A843URL1_COLES|nr:hypothetical protein [Colocasia esculenta]